jgi:mono/diheme cytochrome c family protein
MVSPRMSTSDPSPESASGAPKAPPEESKASRRLITFGVVLAFAFGLIVPAWVLIDNAESGASTVDGVHLNAEQQKGRELFAQKCISCHTLSAVKSVGRIGPNLDIRVGEEIPTESERRALVLNTILEGKAEGKGNMPADLFVGKEAEDVASFVAAVAGH